MSILMKIFTKMIELKLFASIMAFCRATRIIIHPPIHIKNWTVEGIYPLIMNFVGKDIEDTKIFNKDKSGIIGIEEFKEIYRHWDLTGIKLGQKSFKQDIIATKKIIIKEPLDDPRMKYVSFQLMVILASNYQIIPTYCTAATENPHWG